nr:aldo/keto reductase [bacterium]
MDFVNPPYYPDEGRYDGRMPYRRVGKSGLKLPALSLGLWHTFGISTPYEVSRQLARRAFDLGITHFDIANNYGPPEGGAETTFGRILKSDFAAHRDELIISTKSGYWMWHGPYGEWGSRKQLMASLDQSLKRLGVDYVDIFYHHRPDPETPLEETMGALADCVRQGKALYVGISNYNAEDTARAAEILKGMGVHLLIHQANYSLFSRWSEHGLQQTLSREGMGMIAFCPLAQGLLTDKYFKGIPEDSRAASSSPFLSRERVTQDKVARAMALNEIAKKRGQTLAQMSLAWVLRGEVTSALIGASRVSQLEENVAALQNTTFTAEELAAIDAILKED